MIDEKKIEEAAHFATDTSNLIEVSKGMFTFSQETLDNTFKMGINWFKKNLWHDASEEPEEGREILYEYYRNSTIFKCPTYNTQFIMSVDYQDIVLNPKYGKTTRWLYIDDLMKGEK